MARISSIQVIDTTVETDAEGAQYALVQVAVKVGRRTHSGEVAFWADRINGGVALDPQAPFDRALEDLIRRNTSGRASVSHGWRKPEAARRRDFVDSLTRDIAEDAAKALREASED
jgi:hypothetical protein